jgi:hypothetical protein
MALKKDIEIPAYGVIASHHVVVAYAVELVGKRSMVTVSCFASAEAYANGRNPLAQECITLSEIPSGNAVTLDWIEGKLVEAETVPEVAGEIQPGMAMPQLYTTPNRWVFSGADLV